MDNQEKISNVTKQSEIQSDNANRILQKTMR